jgi:hypothetical protein
VGIKTLFLVLRRRGTGPALVLFFDDRGIRPPLAHKSGGGAA